MARIENYIKAGYPAVWVISSEEDRVLNEVKAIAQELSLQIAVWSLTKGIEFDGKRTIVQDPVGALQSSLKFPPNTLYILIDFHPYVKSPDVWRTMKDLFSSQKQRGITFLFISCRVELPPELEREIVIVDFELPTREELAELLEQVAKAANISCPENPQPIIEAALGLTLHEAENAFALSLVVTGAFDAKVISKEKEQIIKKSGILEIYSPDAGLESVGGLQTLKRYLELRVSAFDPQAQAFGLPYPRGILLVGVPGCGKSLTAKALASSWGKPLLRLDVGAVFGSLVGESESNIRRALRTAEAVAPCVLWLDEIEKGLSGVQSSGRTDGGTTARVFGTFLTWLQEKRSAVFVIATANDLTQLPPEFLRKGRFDEIFFVDLPSAIEREEIIKIQLQKRHRDPAKFDIDKIIAATDGFTGAEIEEAIVSALFTAWSEKRDLTTEDVIVAAKSITPLSLGMSDRIEALRLWAEKNARRANAAADTVSAATRVIRR